MASRFGHLTAINTAGMVGIVILWMLAIATDCFADPVNAEWRTETQLYLAGITGYQVKNGSSMTYDSVVTAAELKFYSDNHPLYASLFVEYEFAGDDRFDDVVNVGTYVNYKLQKWDATTFLVVDKTPGKSDAWKYAARLRYRILTNHKVGVEAMGAFERPNSPALAVVYYGSLTNSLSLNIKADPGINSDADFAARMELVWQVR